MRHPYIGGHWIKGYIHAKEWGSMSVTIPLTKLTQPGLFMRRTYNPLSDYTLIRVLRANREGRLIGHNV